MKLRSSLTRLPKLSVRFAAVVMVGLTMSQPVQAAFHLWGIREIYSNGSGTLQFIEFFTGSGSQQFVGGQSLSAVNVGSTLTHTFTIPSHLPSDSANHAFLIATAGLQAAGGPVPDYIMPDNFLFTAGGTINFFGFNSGPYTALPTDGILSRLWGGGDLPNSPQNFAGQTGFVPEPSSGALLGLGALGALLGLRRRGKEV